MSMFRSTIVFFSGMDGWETYQAEPSSLISSPETFRNKTLLLGVSPSFFAATNALAISKMADVPLALPALPRAQKVQKCAAQVNFDWVDTPAVLDKLQEELDELRRAMSGQNSDAIQNEMGDVLFTCVNLARHLNLDAEESLRHATVKFERRFNLMEAAAATDGVALSTLSEVQLDHLWRQAKEELDSN